MSADYVTPCGHAMPGWLGVPPPTCERGLGHLGRHFGRHLDGPIMSWPNDDPVPREVVERAQNLGYWITPEGRAALAAAKAEPLYWLRFGGIFRLPTIHAPGCGWYGAGRGAYITVDQRADVDPRSRARDCKLCGGMWADLET